ncbi:mitochondrial import receptor protein [Verticillium nonalfalfae]|uniref:Mitochondrial import receptor protein n=1 Tax=Verticillium nonalfalfae TaxID=1051616 RepID=A0A3M9YHV1_9PEZI|nr:mitochondrial import receptor protein [Verticillium nonalfalfae]RNJ59631.1 mitochondrial import receptor protein [Verticillium nonalfalfae]
MDPQPESIIFDAACLLAWKNKFRHHDTTIYTRLFGLHPYPRLSKTEVASDLLPQIHRRNPYTAKMVQLVEVEDEHFQGNPNVIQDDDADFTDTDSEISADSDFDPSEETLAERLAALKDIIPPTTRGWIGSQVNTGASIVQNTWYYGSRTLWLVCATALMIGVPLATCWAEDQQIEGMEREYRMREMGGELLTAGEGQEGSTADMLGESLGAGKAEARPSL